MPTEDAVYPAKAEEDVPGVVASPVHRHDGADDVFQECLDVAVTGNRPAGGTIRKFIDAVEKVAPLDRVGPARQVEVFVSALEMTRRLIHAPYGISHGLVQSAVVVDVDVNVDIASKQAPQQRIREERENGES